MAEQRDFTYRPPRTSLMADADLFRSGRHLGQMRIRNLSAEGLGGSGYSLVVDDDVQVRLNGIGVVNARVIWTKGSVFGLALADKVAVDDFDITGDMSGGTNFATNNAVQGQFKRYAGN